MLRVASVGFATIALLLVSSSLLLTTVFPHDEEKAGVVLDGVADAMREHREAHGAWPEDLDALAPSVERRYRWNEVEYVPDERELWLDVRIATDPDLAYRLSFGLAGRAEETIRIGRRLR